MAVLVVGGWGLYMLAFWQIIFNKLGPCVCPQMASKGLYKAMGELDLLFNYFETYLASKRNRNLVAVWRAADALMKTWKRSQWTLLLRYFQWYECCRMLISFMRFLNWCLCCSETSVYIFIVPRTSFQTILCLTHIKLQPILSLVSLWYLFSIKYKYNMYLFRLICIATDE